MSRTLSGGAPGGRADATARSAPGRRGYALLAALWLTVALTTLGTVAVLAARQAIAASDNRATLLRARWRAEGCATRALATLDGLLRAEQRRPGGVFDRWRALDSTLAEAGLGPDVAVVAAAAPWPLKHTWPSRPLGGGVRCIVHLEPAGARADLNALDEDALRALLRAVELPTARADALAAALVAWRRGRQPGGSSVAGETTSGLARELGALQQLLEVPGFDSALVAAVGAVADVESGRLYLRRAPVAALAALPVFGPEVLTRLGERRRLGASLSLSALAGDVSPSAARALAEQLGLLAARVTEDPDAWILSATAVGADRDRRVAARARDGRASPRSLTGTVELRLERAGWRVAVMRRRSWW